MKQFLLFFIGMLTSYFLWSYAAKSDKKRLKRFGLRHVVAVAVITTGCITLLLLMFYNRAISIL